MWDVRSVWSQDRFFCFFIFIWQYLWWWYFSFFISLTIIILIMRRFFHNTHSQVIFLRYTFQFLRRMLPFGQRFTSVWNKRLLVFSSTAAEFKSIMDVCLLCKRTQRGQPPWHQQVVVWAYFQKNPTISIWSVTLFPLSVNIQDSRLYNWAWTSTKEWHYNSLPCLNDRRALRLKILCLNNETLQWESDRISPWTSDNRSKIKNGVKYFKKFKV